MIRQLDMMAAGLRLAMTTSKASTAAPVAASAPGPKKAAVKKSRQKKPKPMTAEAKAIISAVQKKRRAAFRAKKTKCAPSVP